MSNPIPPPVGFSINAAQGARRRKFLFAAGGARTQDVASALAFLFAIFATTLQARTLGWQNPLLFVPAMFYAAGFALQIGERSSVAPFGQRRRRR